MTLIPGRRIVVRAHTTLSSHDLSRSHKVDRVQLLNDKPTWVLYRCTYKDEKDWIDFKRRLASPRFDEDEAEEEDECYQSISLWNHVDWIFIEDRETLDGASKDQLRVRFNAWAAEVIASGGPDAREFKPAPKFMYFCQVDDRALEDKVVNVVEASWRPVTPEERNLLPPENEEPVEGCRAWDVGWFRIRASEIREAETYEEAHEPFNFWKSYYTRPYDWRIKVW